MFSTIKSKIFGTILIGTSIIFIVIALSFSAIKTTLNDYIALDESHIKTGNIINEIHLSFKSSIQAWKNTLIRGEDPHEREKYWQEFLIHSTNLKKSTTTLLNNPYLSEKNKRALKKFSTQFSQIEAKYRRGYQFFIANNFDISATDASVKGVDRSAAKILSQLSAQLIQSSLTTSENLYTHTKQLLWRVPFFITFICLILLAMLYVLLTRKIIEPIIQLIDNIKCLSESNFHFTNSYKSRDELGQLACHTRKLKEKMSNSVSQVSLVGYQVDNSFNQLKKLSTEISQGAQTQFNCVTDMQNSMSELAQTSTTLTGCVESSINANQSVEALTSSCMTAFSNNKTEMQSLVAEVDLATQRTQALQQETNSISTILEVINSVAEQTNLLALNAAIEAARAGEAGRGFAVVADEVRALAGKTRESTNMINDVINTLQNASESAVSSMVSGQKLTMKTAQNSDNLMQHLQDIFDQLVLIKQSSNDVETAAKSQQSISANLNNVLELVKKSSDEYLAIAQDTTVSSAIGSAAEELQKLSFGLSENTPDDGDELF